MKKFLAVLSSFVMLLAVSCDENKQEHKGNTSVNQSSENTSAENGTPKTTETKAPEEIVFKEYKKEDFTDFKVSLTKQEGLPPVEVKEYDLTKLTADIKISPCKLPENIDISMIDTQYKDTARSLDMTPEEYSDMVIENFEEYLSTPPKLKVTKTAFDGENLYYIADYDNLCDYSTHGFGIYCYNPESDENTCIYEYSDINKPVKILDMQYHNGGIWIIYNDNMEKSYGYEKIIRIDVDTGELTEELQIEGEHYNCFFYINDEKRLIITTTKSETIDEEYHVTINFKEYDDNTGEWSDKLKGLTKEYDSITSENSIYPTICEGDVIFQSNEDKKLVIECERYRLETGLRSASFIGATSTRASFIVADSISSVIYTYDFTNMTRYIIDLTSFGQYFNYQQSGNNIILSNRVVRNRSWYLIPEIGAVFELMKSNEKQSNSVYDINSDHSITNIYGGKIALVSVGKDSTVRTHTGEPEDYIPKPEYHDLYDANYMEKMVIIGGL